MTERHDARLRPIRLALSWRYVAGFAALTILCGTSHEFVHHFAGAAICGGFGTKSFNAFELAPGCETNPWRFWATAAGPIFTFALMWWGVVLLHRSQEAARRMGFALIFANFPVNRLFFVLIGGNDEGWLARQLLGRDELAHWGGAALTWAIALPPVIWGYRAIANERRPLWFAGFFILPFLFVFVFAGLFLEELVLLKWHVLARGMWGVPMLVVVVEIVALAGYAAFKADLAGLHGGHASGTRLGHARVPSLRS